MVPEPRLEPPDEPQEPYRCFWCGTTEGEMLVLPSEKAVCKGCLSEIADSFTIGNLSTLLRADIVENG